MACGGVGLIRLCFRGMLCRGLASWSDFVSGGTESSRTRRWKEVDSNSRSRIKRSPLQALRHAGCAASKAVMIGDRLDNDIRPARLLGWRTVRVLQGPGRFQSPRDSWDEPDLTVANVTLIPLALIGRIQNCEIGL